MSTRSRRPPYLRIALIAGLVTGLALIVADVACPQSLGDAAVIAAASADIVSTHVAMQRGGAEVNTVSSLRGQAAIHLGVSGAAILLAHEADRSGHRGWARVVRAVPIVIFGGAAAWNFSRGGRR